MPRVPTLKNREVLPAAGGSFLSSDVPSGAFGASRGKAIARVGDKVQEVGDITLKYALAQQEEDDKREASKLDVEFSSFLRQLTYGDETGGGYLNEKGENAIGQFGPTEEAIIRKRQELFESASNGNVKQLFKEASRSRKDRTMSQYMQHVAKERVAANDAVDDARIKDAQNDAATSRGDPKILDRSLVITEQTIRDKGERNGWSAEQTEREVEAARTRLLSKTILTVSITNNDNAKKLYALYQDQIDGVNQGAILSKLQDADRQAVIDRNRQRQEQRRIEAEEREKNFAASIVAVAEGNMDIGLAKSMLRAGLIDTSNYFTILKYMKSEAEGTSDPNAFLSLQIKVNKGLSSYKEIAEADNIGGTDKRKLIDRQRTVLQSGGRLNEDEVKRGRERIETVVVGAKGIYDKLDTEERLRLDGALKEYTDRILAGEEVDVAVEKVMKKFPALHGIDATKQIRAAGIVDAFVMPDNANKESLRNALTAAYREMARKKGAMDRIDYLMDMRTLKKYRDIIESMEN